MITSPTVAKMAEVTARYSWQIECRDDERLKLGARHKRWLTLRYCVQTGRPVPSHIQGARAPGPKATARMQALGLIECVETETRYHFKRDWTVTRDGQGAVTWHYNVWAPLECAPTWGIPILVRLPYTDRWPDRFFAMRGERRNGELYWITRISGTTYTDRFETGEWRAIP